MAQNKSNDKGNISGRNIYLDRNGQTVYYDWLTKKGYLIDKKDEGKFYVYKNRLDLAFAVLIVVNAWMMEASIAVLVVSVLLSVMACYCVIINLIALTKMK